MSEASLPTIPVKIPLLFVLGIIMLMTDIRIIVPTAVRSTSLDSEWETQDASGCTDATGDFDAFIPGMRGWGSCTRGGFVPGTTVISVTNRNATGAGSLDAAFDASCPKVILFDVGGLIERDGQFTAEVCDQWSVVGASAPGNVTVASGPTDFTGLIETNGNNWTIDHLTVASGSTPTGNADSINIGDGRGASSGEGTAILLNNTFIWGRDEIIQCHVQSDDTQENILVWQNIIGVLLDAPNTGALTTSEHCRWLATIRNLYVHSNERVPLMVTEPVFLANNIIANIFNRGPQIGPCQGGRDGWEPSRYNVLYNLNAKSDDSTANQRFLENPSGSTCTTVQVYEEGNQVREDDGTLYDCTNHGCSGNKNAFDSGVWETSVITAAYPTGYVPEVITRNQTNLETFAIMITDYAGPRPVDRLSYTQTRMVDEALGMVDGTDTSSTYSQASTLAAEGGISAITPADTDWTATDQCPSHVGNPANSPDTIGSSGLTQLHEWVIECFYDSVMPSGYRESL